MSSLCCWTRTRKNSKRAYEAQTVDNLREQVKAGNECGTAEGFELSVLPSNINHQPSAIDQAASTSSQNSTTSQFATVGRPRSLNANNEPATGSHDIQTSNEYIISLPDHLVSCQDEMERLIKNSIEDIEKNNEILREIKRLTDEGKLEEVGSRCYEVLKFFNRKRPWDYLRKKLNLIDDDVRKGDVIFYYLVRGEEPRKLYIIHRALYPRFAYLGRRADDFYELYSGELWFDEASAQLWKRLDNNQTALEYLLYTKPGLLLNKTSPLLIKQLIDNTQLDVHQIITNVRDKKGQTYMFYIGDDWHCIFKLYGVYFSVYRKNIEDFYDLLSIQNCDGKTALHVNPEPITHILADIYTPKQREAFITLTSIEDNSNRTAVEVCNDDWGHDNLSALMNRVKNNEYVMNLWEGTRVLIIYNTNKRPGAEEEAQTVYNAFKPIISLITIKKNKNKADIIKFIEESANKRRYPDGTPIKSLIVILTSHGSVGTIADCDGNPIELSAIEQAMCSDILDGRPKMLITQCCQIGEESPESEPYVPTHDDFCAVMSCVSGQASERSVFLDKLSERIEMLEWDTDIFKVVSNISKEMKNQQHKQTPIIMSTLKARFCPSDDWRWRTLREWSIYSAWIKYINIQERLT